MLWVKQRFPDNFVKILLDLVEIFTEVEKFYWFGGGEEVRRVGGKEGREGKGRCLTTVDLLNKAYSC